MCIESLVAESIHNKYTLSMHRNVLNMFKLKDLIPLEDTKRSFHAILALMTCKHNLLSRDTLMCCRDHAWIMCFKGKWSNKFNLLVLTGCHVFGQLLNGVGVWRQSKESVGVGGETCDCATKIALILSSRKHSLVFSLLLSLPHVSARRARLGQQWYLLQE